MLICNASQINGSGVQNKRTVQTTVKGGRIIKDSFSDEVTQALYFT